MDAWASAAEIAEAVTSGRTKATTIVEAALARIADRNPVLNAFTAVTTNRALTKARAVDDAVARGKNPGPLAGAPFAVKNLFDELAPPRCRRVRLERHTQLPRDPQGRIGVSEDPCLPVDYTIGGAGHPRI